MKQGKKYSCEKALKDFAFGFASDLAARYVCKFGAKAVAKGLDKLGVNPAKIKKLTGVDLAGGSGTKTCNGHGQSASGYSTKGYNPKAGERTLNGYVEKYANPEISLHTNSAGFNNNNGNVGGNFKRFGAGSHGGVSPHVHQPQRNKNLKNGNTYGSVGTKTSNGGVTSPTNKDVKQLYEHLNNGKYR